MGVNSFIPYDGTNDGPCSEQCDSDGSPHAFRSS